MVQMNTPSSTGEILSHLSDWDPRSRHEARTKLVYLGETVIPLLIEKLTSKDTHVRWEAVKALGEIKDPIAAEAIVELLQDDDTGVRWAAMGSLIELGRASIKPLLLAITKNFGSAHLRQGAHHALHALHNMSMLSALEVEVMHALEGTTPGIEAAKTANRALIEEYLHPEKKI